jgi:hypothetical protein
MATDSWHLERIHRATAERILARQGICRNRPAHRPGDPVRKTCKTERAAQIELASRVLGEPLQDEAQPVLVKVRWADLRSSGLPMLD